MYRVLTILLFLLVSPATHAETMRIVALGDSLTAGYGLPPDQAFPAQLEHALRQKGIDVAVENAGISGDTTAGGLARLNAAIAGPVKPRLVIVELGANDMLRRMSPVEMKTNLHKILTTLKEQQIPVLFTGVQMPVFFSSAAYGDAFEDLADEFDVPFYESFLDGVMLKPEYNLEDRMHPNAEGVKVIVKNIQQDVIDILVPPTGIRAWFN